MLRLIVHIVLLAIVVVFVALNVPYSTSVNLFGHMFEDISTVAVVLVSFILGIIYSFFIYVQNYFHKSGKKRVKEKRDLTKEKEKELKTKEKQIAAPVEGTPKTTQTGKTKGKSAEVKVPGDEAEAGVSVQEKKSFFSFGKKGGKDTNGEP